jgi:hypothetical protein
MFEFYKEALISIAKTRTTYFHLVSNIVAIFLYCAIDKNVGFVGLVILNSFSFIQLAGLAMINTQVIEKAKLNEERFKTLLTRIVKK